MSIYKKINYLRDGNQVLTVMRFSLFGGDYEIIYKKQSSHVLRTWKKADDQIFIMGIILF